jgi:hypothetical protein
LYRGDIFLTCTPPGCDKLTAAGDGLHVVHAALDPTQALWPWYDQCGRLC